MLRRIENKQRKLGNTAKKLLIRLIKRRENYYDIVLSRKKSKPTSRLCRFGYYTIVRNEREVNSILALDFNRIYNFLTRDDVEIHSSFAKVIIN